MDLKARDELHAIWRAWMPITAPLGITVDTLDDKQLVLAMPLDPNRNYQGTVFGGSMAALATLAGWSAIWLAMQRSDVTATLLVQDSSIRYPHPARSDLRATAELPEGVVWDAVVDTLAHRGRARLSMRVSMHDKEGLLVAEFTGRYVMMDGDR